MAVTAGYASFFLLGAKLTNSQIGLLLAAGGLLSTLIQPLLAAFADKSSSLSVRFLMMLMSALLLVCFQLVRPLPDDADVCPATGLFPSAGVSLPREHSRCLCDLPAGLSDSAAAAAVFECNRR